MPNKAKPMLKATPTAKGKRTAGTPAPVKPSHQGWPGGLEALAKAQHEGAKVFGTLLKQGQRLEQRTREAAAGTAAAARGAAAAKAREVQQMAGGTWDKLEQVFEERVERALSKLGFHTQNDIQRLADRVDELSEAVNKLLLARGAAPTATAPKTRRPAKRAPKR